MSFYPVKFFPKAGNCQTWQRSTLTALLPIPPDLTESARLQVTRVSVVSVTRTAHKMDRFVIKKKKGKSRQTDRQTAL